MAFKQTQISGITYSYQYDRVTTCLQMTKNSTLVNLPKTIKTFNPRQCYIPNTKLQKKNPNSRSLTENQYNHHKKPNMQTNKTSILLLL